MPEFRPFAAIRYRAEATNAYHPDTGNPETEHLDVLTAPPYDVIDPDQREALAARSEHNAVRLILPGDGDGYERAACQLREWEAAGVLVRDAAPAFYSYRMTYVDDRDQPRHTVGIIGGLVLPSAAGEGDVLPHERTLPKAKSDRLALLRATRVNLDPIWGLTPTTGLAAIADRSRHLATTIDEDGVTHELGALTEPDDLAAVAAIVADAPVVLADGHHRFETAIAYRDEQRARGIGVSGNDAVMGLIVELAENQLWVQPIHRVLNEIGSPTRLRLNLARRFRIVDAARNTPETVTALVRSLESHGGVGLVDGEGLARLVADEDDLERARQKLDPVLGAVPSAWFEVMVGDALDGVTITYRHDAQALAAMVDTGAVDAAILLAPVTVEQIRSAAKARVRMPQKTTFFAPKPRTGLVFRSLDGDQPPLSSE